VAADDSDDPSVLGNLPRSRPGQRSSKRASGAKPAAKSTPARKAPATAGPARSQGAKRSGGATPASRAAARKTTRPPTAASSSTASGTAEPPRQRREQPQPGDPLSQAVRLAGKVAETGVKTGVGILKRISGR